jgi:hypothetical protein
MSDLNPGIRNLVAWLNERGYETCDSGDGQTHDFACDRTYPYVVIQIEEPREIWDRTQSLLGDLAREGIEVRPVSGASFPQMQATYDPADGTAFIELMHVDDAMLAAARRALEDGD